MEKKNHFSLKKNVLKNQMQSIDSNLLTSNTDNIVNKLQKQMEFYLGDSNLLNDKFLRNLMNQNKKKYIDLVIFLNFNKIKKILDNSHSIQHSINLLKQAIESSEVLKLNKDKTMVKRKVKFNEEINNDNKIIYVENFPENTSHEILANIFSKIGPISYISIPKYSETKAPKGFAFIEFKNIEDVNKAVQKYNNCIPEEYFKEETIGKLIPLRVISKFEWLQLKQQYKDLKKKLINVLGNEETEKISNRECIDNSNYIEQNVKMEKDCLILLKNLPKNTTKQDIRISVSHFCAPAYIDFKKMNNFCIIRFDNKTLCESFYEKYTLTPLKILKEDIEIEKIQGEKELEYWDEINKKKNSFKRFVFDMKHNKKIKK